MLNGKYLAQNTSLGDMSADISTTTRSDGNVYLSKLDFTLNASSVLINLENMTLVDNLSHSSYPSINATLNNDIIQLEKGTAGFESYFYGLSA